MMVRSLARQALEVEGWHSEEVTLKAVAPAEERVQCPQMGTRENHHYPLHQYLRLHKTRRDLPCPLTEDHTSEGSTNSNCNIHYDNSSSSSADPQGNRV